MKYADPLKAAIKSEFKNLNLDFPNFYSSFWGNALSDVDRMWSCIDRDLEKVKEENPEIDLLDCFRYRQFREGFLSEFIGDMFTYLNQKRGFEIRKSIAQQLTQFLQENPQDSELHIITHSLGSVIFWDIFFSERFTENDPAFDLRAKIKNLGIEHQEKQVFLKSITTMGSPILFFNTMLGVNPNRVKEFAQRNQNYGLKWLNIIDSSDIISYPLKSSFDLDDCDRIKLKDIYVDTNNNFAAKTARSIGQDLAALALDTVKAHTGYWSCSKTVQLIMDNLCDEKENKTSNKKYIQQVIDRLQNVTGISIDKLKLFINDEPIATLKFADGSGKLFHVVNAAKIHHVYVYNEMNLCLFAGYVGWIHTNSLQQAIYEIKNLFIFSNSCTDRIKIHNLNHLRNELLACRYCSAAKLSFKKDFDNAVFVSKLDDGYYTYYLNHSAGGQHLYVSSIPKSENFESSYNSIVLAYHGAFLGRDEILNIVRQLRGF
ncbi:MAG: hypothetical protein ACRC2V_26805 [Xenococcaceae cyanobacterium]